MVHTITLHCTLSEEEIFKITEGNKIDLTTFLSKRDENFEGFTGHIYKKFACNFFITVDLIEVLKKFNIVDNDYSDIEKNINLYLEGLNLNINDMTLIRIDYREDIIFPTLEKRKLILNALKTSLDSYWFKEKDTSFGSSLYYNNKSIQIIAYDKEIERNSTGKNPAPEEKNIIRFEVRLCNKHLNTQKTKYGTEKTLKCYLNKESQLKYINKYLKPIFFNGDFYTYNLAVQKIKNSKLKDYDKKGLLEFMSLINTKGINYTKKTCTNYKFNKYKSLLEELKINPLLISSKSKEDLFIENPLKNTYI